MSELNEFQKICDLKPFLSEYLRIKRKPRFAFLDDQAPLLEFDGHLFLFLRAVLIDDWSDCNSGSPRSISEGCFPVTCLRRWMTEFIKSLEVSSRRRPFAPSRLLRRCPAPCTLRQFYSHQFIGAYISLHASRRMNSKSDSKRAKQFYINASKNRIALRYWCTQFALRVQLQNKSDHRQPIGRRWAWVVNVSTLS